MLENLISAAIAAEKAAMENRAIAAERSRKTYELLMQAAQEVGRPVTAIHHDFRLSVSLDGDIEMIQNGRRTTYAGDVEANRRLAITDIVLSETLRVVAEGKGISIVFSS